MRAYGVATSFTRLLVECRLASAMTDGFKASAFQVRTANKEPSKETTRIDRFAAVVVQALLT
jgi:hypothetical protein